MINAPTNLQELLVLEQGAGKPCGLGVYASWRLSFDSHGKACIWKMACRAEVRTGLGKSDRPGSQGGSGKRGLWWN